MPKSPPGPPPAAAATAETPRAARLLRRVALRRTARGARAEVVLRRSANARRLEGRLVRRGKTVAVAAAEVRERRAVLRFHAAGELPAGEYTLLLAVVDGAGRTLTRRRRVALR